jgi:ligand-binding sensor domain-containing protein
MYRWDGSAWRQLLAPGPRSDKPIRSLAIAADGALWFTHQYPVLGSFSGAGWAQHDAGNTGGGLENQWTAGLEIASNGDLWVGHCCCPGDVNCRVDRRAFPGNGWAAFPDFLDVMAIAEDPSGDLWFGTVAHGSEDNKNGIYRLAHDDSTQAQFLVADTGGCLPSNQVRALLAPADDRVIFGSLGDGVAVWDYGSSVTDLTDDQCVSFRQSTGELRGDDVTSLLLRGGELWVGTTAGISVISLASGSARFITTSHGLAGDQVACLASDPQGRIWVATRSGASLITPQGSGQRIENFAYPDLVNERLNSVGVDARSGRVWFGTDRGLSAYQAWDPGQDGPGGLEASVYPNPYRPARDGALRLIADGGAGLRGEIYDLSGRRVAAFSSVGSDRSFWDGTMSSGAAAPSGLYVIVIRSDSGAVARAQVAVIR